MEALICIEDLAGVAMNGVVFFEGRQPRGTLMVTACIMIIGQLEIIGALRIRRATSERALYGPRKLVKLVSRTNFYIEVRKRTKRTVEPGYDERD